VQARETLVAHISDCDNSLQGSSLCVAATLSLLSLLLEVGRLGVAQRRASPGSIVTLGMTMSLLAQLPASRDKEGEEDVVVVTGDMDLIGRVHGVVGLAGKIQVRQGGPGPRCSLRLSTTSSFFLLLLLPVLLSSSAC
jgi:hypothetical protein